MARVHGRHGRLYLAPNKTAAASPVAGTKSWTIDSATTFANATAQGDSSEVSLAGLPGGTGSFEAYYDSASYTGNIFASSQTGEAVRMYWYPDHTDTAVYGYTTAYVSGSMTSDVNGVTSVSGKFASATGIYTAGIS